MKMFLPQNTSYLQNHCDTQIKKLKVELLKFEENDDAAYADQTRKKISAFEECKSLFSDIVVK